MPSIKGISVTLWEKQVVDVDPFGVENYAEVPVTVEDVLVAPASDEDRAEALNLYGRRAQYTMAIPKGDTHDWGAKRITFFGEDWRMIGHGVRGIEENIPLRWNMKIMVESYGKAES